MSIESDVLYEKLKALPPRRRAEVEDFVDFLARKESRGVALDRLLAIAPALEATGKPRITEEEIAAEIKSCRAEKRTRVAQSTKTTTGRT